MARGGEDLPNGTPVVVAGSVGDDVTGNLRGRRGQVYGVNATYRRPNGEAFVNVKLDDGSCVSMPARALREKR